MQQRFFIELAYNGTAYCGWQRQLTAVSVQEVMEDILSKLHSGASVPVVGCGRTDTGVHAQFYVLHVELDSAVDPIAWKQKLNKMLPKDIVVFRIFPVAETMHARFSATERTYRYFLHQEKSPFLSNSLYFPQHLDFNAMNEAAKGLLGTQDFTSLSKLHTDVKTNICTVSRAEWIQQGDQWYFEITADRFLRNMVRAAVGTLLEVGTGKIQPSEVRAILAAKDRGAAKTSVEAKGLFLWKVSYE